MYIYKIKYFSLKIHHDPLCSNVNQILSRCFILKGCRSVTFRTQMEFVALYTNHVSEQHRALNQGPG